jgi:hypothetical protein
MAMALHRLYETAGDDDFATSQEGVRTAGPDDICLEFT